MLKIRSFSVDIEEEGEHFGTRKRIICCKRIQIPPHMDGNRDVGQVGRTPWAGWRRAGGLSWWSD